MRYLNITYHMNNGRETAETCITLPMETRTAADILKHQCSSPHASPKSAVGRILSALASLQGYDNAAFCCAEERNPSWHDTWKENPNGK